MSFINNLQSTLGEEFNESVTENGAIGYRTTGKELLDLNFKISSLRSASPETIAKAFWNAYYENPLICIKWLFYVSDVRGGIGERRLFRICFRQLALHKEKAAEALLTLIPEYSRWDNIMATLRTNLESNVIDIIKNQLSVDMENMKAGKPISLLAKWMPSCNTSSADTRERASIIMKGLGLDARRYRKMLSSLRSYLDIVERKMSSGEWGAIDYSKVPSRANLMYNSAFLRNDEERRREFLDKLQKGETKINAGTLFPHDILYKYKMSSSKDEYMSLEELWKNLPDFVKGDESTLCISDGSGSMYQSIGIKGSKVQKIDVAMALTIYFAERCKGQFKDKFITFSENPQLVSLNYARNLADKIRIMQNHNEIANTNIEAVFDLVLLTALQNKMKQEELPKNLLILSDMEFDHCATCNNAVYGVKSRNLYYGINYSPSPKLFAVIKQKYEAAGYQLPRMIFWNIDSSTGTIPVKENNLGVALVSGFSPSIVKMVLSNNLDPYECLLEQVNSERYDMVEKAVNGIEL